MKKIALSEPEKDRLRNLDEDRKELEREIQELTLSILESREIDPNEIAGLTASKDFSSLIYQEVGEVKKGATAK